uniref:G-protein coupled receptors family 3 profile domain-containing protein n=1 Tax=Knipowitschia caucasica TaxID=637954 RepID=A0AAV2LEG4_KNICA
MASFKDRLKQQLSSSLYQSIKCAMQEMLGQVESLVERAVERALLPEDQGTLLDCPSLTSAVSQINISEAHLRLNEALVAGTSGNTEFSGTGVFQEQDFGDCFNEKVENNQQELDERQTDSYSDDSNEAWREKHGATSSRGWKKKDSVQKEEVTQSEVTPHCSDVCGTAAPEVNISQLQLSSNQSLSVDGRQTDPFFDSDDSNETWVRHGATPSRGWKKKDSDQKEVTQSGEIFRVDQGPGLDFPCPIPAAPEVNISQLQLSSNQSLSDASSLTRGWCENRIQFFLHPSTSRTMSTNSSVPRGCVASVDSLYYSLCDLSAVWGVVLEAFAAAGIVFCFVLFIALLASLPFTKDKNRRSSIPLHAFFLFVTCGLFCLTFAFIVGKDFSTCASRRFLFGVLFAGCFSCLLMHAVRLNFLVRRDSGPPSWALGLGMLGLCLVEAIINTEWLIITIVRAPLPPLNGTEIGRATATPCNIANQDFVMALIYVMVLISATFVASLVIMCAIALVANAWVFLVVHTIPEVCCLGIEEDEEPALGQDLYPSRAVGFETILKDQSSQNLFMENKAFSMDEPSHVSKPMSPYSGYTGQLRASVYQPTELALISKSTANRPPEVGYDNVIPRATAPSAGSSGQSTPSTRADSNGSSGNGLHRTTQW